MRSAKPDFRESKMSKMMGQIVFLIAMTIISIVGGQEILLGDYNEYETPNDFIALDSPNKTHTGQEVHFRDFFRLDQRTETIVWSPQAIVALVICCIIGFILAIICLYINYKEDESSEAFVGRRVFH
jgi:hypothetical protein